MMHLKCFKISKIHEVFQQIAKFVSLVLEEILELGEKKFYIHNFFPNLEGVFSKFYSYTVLFFYYFTIMGTVAFDVKMEPVVLLFN